MCNHTHFVKLKDGRRVPVPCGFCAVCRAGQRDEWQKRLEIECLWNERQGFGNSFLTLTIDDDHLPSVSDPKRPVQLFWKKVRKSLPSGSNPRFKYFLVSEYGSTTGRLHYHAIVCGLDYALCASLFRKSWNLGFVVSLPIRDGAVRYVLKYIEKSHTSKRDSEIYASLGIPPPIRLISKGIGLDFFIANQHNLRMSNGVYRWHGKDVPVPEYVRRSLGIRSRKNLVGAKFRVHNSRSFENRLVSRCRNENFPVYTPYECDVLVGRRSPVR